MASTKAIGAQGERDAAAYLRGLGAEILETNYRCPWGEIDIVARMDGALVFCEVKTRRSDRYGTPAEAVTRAKQRRIIRTAEVWLAAHQVPEGPIRFDVVTVQPGRIRHIPGAFDASQ